MSSTDLFPIPEDRTTPFVWLLEHMLERGHQIVERLPGYSISLIERRDVTSSGDTGMKHYLFDPIPKPWIDDLYIDFGHRYVLGITSASDLAIGLQGALKRHRERGLSITRLDRGFLEFLTITNGVRLYDDRLSVRGVNLPAPKRFGVQPFALSSNLLESFPGQTRVEICVASNSEDGSRFFSDTETGKIRQLQRGKQGALMEWPSFEDFMRSEIKRLDS
jgi:hypothetical protein